jgi:hypothetical protein
MTGSVGPAGRSNHSASEEGTPHSSEQDGRRRLDGPHLYIVHRADSPQAHPMTRTRLPPVRSPKGMLDRSIQAQIGRMLRDVFTDISSEPVPERFVRLLQALESKEKKA